MTPGLAANLTIHDPEAIGVDTSETGAALAQRALGSPRPRGLRVVEGGDTFVTPRRRREGLRRLLLCGADVFAAAAAMVLVLTVLGKNQLKPITLAGTPVAVLFFKVAGLYDREQVSGVALDAGRGTGLIQVAGLYTLDGGHPPAAHRRGGIYGAVRSRRFG